MKNKIKWIVCAGLVVVAIFAISVIKRLTTPITYSNLNSDKSIEQTLQILKQAEIQQNNIDIFTQQVKFTNDYLKTLPNLQGDFITKKGTVVKYDTDLAFNLFTKVLLPEDMNCRLAAYNLIKDNLTVILSNEAIEYAEQSILDYYPYTGFENGDKEKFWGINKPIPAGIINTTKGYAKIIKQEWAKRELTFENNNIKLINCFAYSMENKWLEAVHTGVTIQQDDKIIFIEKYNPKAPFQVSIFNNEKQLKYYLQQRLMSAFILQPIIMSNDQLL